MTRGAWIGIVVSALALVAMYFDHLAHGADDWVAFAISAVLVLAVAGYLFGVVVRRAHGNADRAGRLALVVGLLAVPSLALIWIGTPWIVAGAAIALGSEGGGGRYRRRATIGLVLGAVVLVLSLVGSDWQSDADAHGGRAHAALRA